jgi:hypothetical protein
MSEINTSIVGINDHTATLDHPFKLSVNQVASIEQTDLNICFAEVTEDSRCPLHVKCIWAGQLSVLVDATKASTGRSLGSFTLTLMTNRINNYNEFRTRSQAMKVLHNFTHSY